MFKSVSLTATAFALLGITSAVQAQALEKVVFATNWFAAATHGGFYQSVVDGTYKKCGLDVEIQQGGPQVNNRPFLPAGKIDFLMTGNMLLAFDATKNKLPTKVVMAAFQKDPQVVIAHPQFDTWEKVKTANPLFISSQGMTSFFQWMKSDHGFKDDNVKPYTFNIAPFMATSTSAQQGYLTSEPERAKENGLKVQTYLLANHGWSTYSTVVETRTDLIEKKPKVVECFVNGSIEGWVNFMYGDRSEAMKAIMKDNKNASLASLELEVRVLKENGIVDSGDSRTLGVGAMTDARMKDFYDKMVKAGILKANDLNLKDTYTTQFVNKNVGADLKRKFNVQ
jgi:NitT/TauT family transport system substrate-binding protein